MLAQPEPSASSSAAFVPESSEAAPDELATAEAHQLATGTDLERDGKTREHGRHQTFRDHVNRAMLALFWVIIACVGAGVAVFAFHLVAPDAWHWLKPAAVEKLQTLLAAALLSSALTGYVNKRMVA